MPPRCRCSMGSTSLRPTISASRRGLGGFGRLDIVFRWCTITALVSHYCAGADGRVLGEWRGLLTVWWLDAHGGYQYIHLLDPASQITPLHRRVAPYMLTALRSRSAACSAAWARFQACH